MTHTGPCTCRPPWPSLVVDLDGQTVPVVPSATPGALADLYWARCSRCGARYPGTWRVPPHAA